MSTSAGDRFPATFDGLLDLVERLRGPSGCAWDREQTRDSMTRYIREECFELIEAIDAGEPGAIVEELGDMLFHLAFQVHVGRESSEFGAEQVFQAVKRQERPGDGSLMDGVPKTLPALSYAQSIQERAAGVGFDWDDVREVTRKVREELDELERAATREEQEAEFGDVLFALVNVGRWLGIDAESTLRGSDERFLERFALMERLSRDRGVSFDSLPLADKEPLWQEAKRLLG